VPTYITHNKKKYIGYNEQTTLNATTQCSKPYTLSKFIAFPQLYMT